MQKKRNILVCPLDWGLGHASRCVPIIKQFLKNDFHVIIGANGRSASFLKTEFPELEHLTIPGYDIQYPSGGSMARYMVRQLPALLKSIKREHQLLDILIDKHHIDAVFSDNRFGLWSNKIPCVYMTHQVTIKGPRWLPLAERILSRLHNRFIKHFDECWIPDSEGTADLSGDLGHKRPAPVPGYFIGPQSRFTPGGQGVTPKMYDLMCVVSGPEPQRSIFEEMIVQQLSDTQYKVLILSGKTELGLQSRAEGNIILHSHMRTEEMQRALLSSGMIICRPGYSSIMDLAVLGLNAAFIPTPGQTEQEYLARYHGQKGNYINVGTPAALDVKGLIEANTGDTGLRIDADNTVLQERIDHLANRLDRLS